jgi:hypothetical protein
VKYSISLKAASINSNSQETLDYYDPSNNVFIANSKIEEVFNNNEDKKAYVKEKLNSGEWLTTYCWGSAFNI